MGGSIFLMSLKPEQRRRWVETIVLGVAVLMLIAGETLLKGRFSPLLMLAYWLACFAMAAMAMILAVMDASAVARRTTEERRELAARTIKEIEQKLQDKQGDPKA
jgi:membrane protein implicated in regulation of membrane protease activity